MAEKTKKTYILDTNVLLDSPHSIYSFDEHDVVLADVTLSELDHAKTKTGEIGYNAREALRLLEELRQRGNFLTGIPLESGGNVSIVRCPYDGITRTADERILKVCEILSESREYITPILVSNDINMRIRAQLQGITAEEYKTDRVDQSASLYAGRREVMVTKELIDRFYADLYLELSDIAEFLDTPLHHNEFLIMRDAYNPSHSAIAKVKDGRIIPLEFIKKKPWDVTPKNVGQKFALEALMDPSIPLVLLLGPAGTGKTFLNLAVGLENIIHQKMYDKLLIFRPMVYFDEGIGYLPGTETEKISPMLRSYYDNLSILTNVKDGHGASYMQDLFDRGIIEAQAMTYMRGRNISNSWLSVDEAQNITIIQAFGVVSRAGMGTKIILAGDPDQIDNPALDQRTNGLRFTAERMKDSPLCAQVTFTDKECVRSPLALDAIQRMSPKGYH